MGGPRGRRPVVGARSASARTSTGPASRNRGDDYPCTGVPVVGCTFLAQDPKETANDVLRVSCGLFGVRQDNLVQGVSRGPWQPEPVPVVSTASHHCRGTVGPVCWGQGPLTDVDLASGDGSFSHRETQVCIVSLLNYCKPDRPVTFSQGTPRSFCLSVVGGPGGDEGPGVPPGTGSVSSDSSTGTSVACPETEGLASCCVLATVGP